jgi:ABC-2 type transport system ATP-binding protein
MISERGGRSLVELRGVSRWYGNVVAVNDVTMTLGPGVTGLLGPNGAGKTTVLHMMAGFLSPSRGQVLVGGQPSWRNPNVYKGLGLVSEREAVHGFLTGWEFVLASARLHRLADPPAAARRAIELVEMSEAQHRRIETYSKGMRQRVRVAAALVHDPGVLLLDEPFNGMDPRQRLQMMDLLHAMGTEGRTVLFSSHILEEVEQVSGTVQVIVAGRLAASGDYRTIRRLMTNRPHVFTIQSSDDRRLAVALMAEASVRGVELDASVGLTVRAGDYGTFTRALPKIVRGNDIRLRRLLPTDESLESVFSYLVAS